MATPKRHMRANVAGLLLQESARGQTPVASHRPCAEVEKWPEMRTDGAALPACPHGVTAMP
eukprot:460799-Alexandrium_andersonii.AAC.1